MSDAEEPAPFDRLAPPALTLDCPCGARLAGNNVPPLALGLFHAAHDEHRREAAATDAPAPPTAEHRLSERARVPTIGGDAEGGDRRPGDGMDGRPPAEGRQP